MQPQPGGSRGALQPVAAGSGQQQADYTVELRHVGSADLERVGGKAANLGELIRAGFPVPAGFAITTAAYDRLVEAAGLRAVITQALHSGNDGAAIRASFEAAPIPAELERATLAAYRALGAGAVAVRSSATAEDLPQAAFAGQQESFLNVVGEEALLEAVRGCWASLWTDRAMAYRQRLGLDQSAVKLAVVVQRMVPAQTAGVLFTANPISGARNESVVDASPGLGEAVVSGLVTPDHLVVRQSYWGWQIVERRPGRREVVIQGRAGGGTEQVASAAGAAGPALPDAAVYQLVRLGAAIERHFARPQDVEWAWSEGQLWIVQARPITSLPQPLPRSLAGPRRLIAGLVGEMLPERPYPLEMTTWGFSHVFSALLGRLFGLFGLRVRPERMFVEEQGVVVRFNGRMPLLPTPGLLLAPLRLRRLARRYDPAFWRADPLLAEAHTRTRALQQRQLHTLSWTELLALVREALEIPLLFGELRYRYLPRVILATARLRLLLGLLRRADHFGTLLLMGVESKTLETNRTLEALAAEIRANPALADIFARHEAGDLWPALEADAAGREFLASLCRFLDDYGHREAGGTMQLSQPSWVDAPQVVLSMLKGLAATTPRPRPRRPEWEAALDQLRSHPLLRLRPLRSLLLRTLADARWFPALREDTRFYATMILPLLRRALLELGQRLVSAGVLQAPEEIFHLKLSEIEQLGGPPPAQQAASLRALVERRKAKRAALAGAPLVDPRLLRPASAEGAGLLSGIPGSPGVVEGPVRIIRAASEFGRLRPGEVLVAPYTNPAWTPLFQQAAAVIVDSGGPGSHAAIVAREYGIPAIMATGDGTARLQDGQRVRVDGDRGLVLALEPASSQPG